MGWNSLRLDARWAPAGAAASAALLSFPDPSEWFKCPWIKKDLDQGKENRATPWGRAWHIWWRKCHSVELLRLRISSRKTLTFFVVTRLRIFHLVHSHATSQRGQSFVFPPMFSDIFFFVYLTAKHFRFQMHSGSWFRVGSWVWRALRWWSSQEHLGLIKYW